MRLSRFRPFPVSRFPFSALLRGSLAATVVAVATTALLAAATQNAQAQIAYSIATGQGNATQLISFNVLTPSIVTTIGDLTGAVFSVEGLDFRASDGLLYGYSQGSNRLVTINLTTAVTTLVATPTTGSTTASLGIDFNPMADRLRLVNFNAQNLRINPADGATTVDGTLTYAAGDRFTGRVLATDVAYTNNVVGAGSTTLYYIDNARQTLATTTNPNGGVVNTVGSLGGSDNIASLDIYTGVGGVNTAYALGGNKNFYTINLQTGAASLIGTVNASGAYPTFAIRPGSAPAATAAAPEPGSLALLLLAGVPVIGIIRRRKKN